MREIARVKPNGLSAISTFSGCGGSCLGLRMDGYRILWTNEFVKPARDCYAANYPKTPLDPRDVRSIKPEQILARIGKNKGEIDLLEGSPPCSSFSTAGRRQENWNRVKQYSETRQRTDDLFFEYIRVLRGTMPRVFVAENVSGLVKGVAKGYFLSILAELRKSGYRVECRLLDAQWLGVPQARQRTIFIGVRNDLKAAPAFPKPLLYRYSIADAIPELSGARISGRTGPRFRRVATEPDEPMNAITVTDPEQTRYEIEASMDGKATGREYDRVSVGYQSRRYFQLVRPDPSEPCPTVTALGGNAGLASVCHPFEKRKFSIAELKRLCSFPDDFVLTGTYAQQWERCGRSVPPLMMLAIGRTIREKILS